MFFGNIKKLVQYGINTGLLPECERIYATNLLLDLFHEDSYEDVDIDGANIELEKILKALLDEAVSRGIIEDSIVYRDLFDTKIMNCLMPRPAQVQAEFAKRYEVSPEEATDYFYKLSQDSDYIRRYRVKKDRKWPHRRWPGGAGKRAASNVPPQCPVCICPAPAAPSLLTNPYF